MNAKVFVVQPLPPEPIKHLAEYADIKDKHNGQWIIWSGLLVDAPGHRRDDELTGGSSAL